MLSGQSERIIGSRNEDRLLDGHQVYITLELEVKP